jgi:hypothetical protein
VDALDFPHDVQLQLAGVFPDRWEPFLVDWQAVVFKMGNRAIPVHLVHSTGHHVAMFGVGIQMSFFSSA